MYIANSVFGGCQFLYVFCCKGKSNYHVRAKIELDKMLWVKFFSMLGSPIIPVLDKMLMPLSWSALQE